MLVAVKYLHIREVDEDGVIQPKGGVTVAYTVNEASGHIMASWVKCRPDELFCYHTGRVMALDRFTSAQGEVEVLDLSHPISSVIADWIATVVWPEGPESWDMGFAIDIDKDDKGRWVSTFLESWLESEFELEVEKEFDVAYAG